MMLLNRYPYEKSETIVCDYSIEALSKLWISENRLHCVCIGTLLKRVNFGIFGGITKIGTMTSYIDPIVQYNVHIQPT